MKTFIEKYSTYIGIGLIVLALVGGVLLMMKKGTQAESGSVDGNSQQKISQLEDKISNLEKENSDLKSVAAIANSAELTSPSSTSNQSSGKINLNSASQSQLESLPGIGPTYSSRIIDYRNQHGGFKSCEEVKNVKGIGDKTFVKFRDLITI